MSTTKAEVILSATDKTKAAFASVSRSLDGMKTGVASLKGGLAGIGAAIGTAFAAGQLRGAIDLLDKLDDLSEKTGITVEKLSELRFAGEAVGTPLEALTSGVQRLSKQMSEAAGGNKEAIETFKTLGVEVKNADGSLRNSEDVLGDLADRFASYEDGAGKAALAQKIFGKSGADMIPLLNQGRKGIEALRVEAQQLGAIYGGELAKDAASFNDNLTKLRLASEAAAISIGGPLLKSLNSLLSQYLEIKKLGSLDLVVKDVAKGFLDPNFSKLSANPGADVKALMGERERLQKAMQDAVVENVGGPEWVKQTNKARQKDLDDVNRYLEISKARQRVEVLGSISGDDAGDAVSRRFREKPKGQAPVIPSGGGGGGGKGQKPKDQEADAKRYLETLDKQLERTEQLSQVEIALAEIRRIQAEGGVVTEAMKQQILLKAADIDATKALTEAEKKRADEQEEAQKRMFEAQDEAKKIFEDTRTPLEEYTASVAKLNELYDQGYLLADTYSRALLKQGQVLEEAQKRAREAGNQQDEYSTRMAENIQDSIGSGLVDIMEGNYKSIGDGFVKMLNRMAAEAAAAQLARAMFGDLAKGGEGEGYFGGILKQFGGALTGKSSKSSGAGGDALEGLLASNNAFGTGGGASGGGWLASLIGGMASFDVGTDYVPEDMIAKIHKGEKIIPAAQNKPGAGGNVYLTQNFPVGTNRKTTDMAARDAGHAISRAQRNS